MNVFIQFIFIFLFLTNIPLYTSNTSNFFRSSKISLELNEILRENSNEEKFSDESTNECLVSESEAYDILKNKYNLDPDYITIDQNIRFILGKCNPILYVPGLYASRMLATINCPVLKHDFLNFVKMRLFCGENICKDETNENEEYVVFPSIFDSPFQIRVTDNVNKYTACQGFFYSFHNSRNECPENICSYSDGIRISFYGGTKKTKKESQCGINSIENILYAGKIIPPLIANKLISANFYVMIQYYRKMGYKDGFSAAGIPFDYRRYIHSNKYFESAFIYQINRLYKNTGKPVVIITHSLGALHSLANLLRVRDDIKNKVKSFVPIVPPFAGSSHLLEAYLYGLRDFDTEIKIGDIYDFKVIITPFAESLYFSFAPVVSELRPQYSLIQEIIKPENNKLKLAVEELIQMEKECWDKNCPSDKIKNMTKNYYDVFGDDFPILSDIDCQLTDEEINEINKNKNKEGNSVKFRKCITNIYDIFKCPLILFEKEFSAEVPAEHIYDLCGIYNKSLLYLTPPETCKPKTYKDIFGIRNIKKIKYNSQQEKIPLESLFTNNAKYPYGFDEFKILLEEYNTKYSQKYNKTLSIEDFETEDKFQNKGKLNVEYNRENNLLTGYPISPVDTYIIYGNYHGTDVSFVYDDRNKKKEHFDSNEYLSTGGDGTVNNYSSMLVGMKWLYEKKVKNLPQTIKLIEYCSFAGKEGKYAYAPKTFKDKTYIALSCDCINSDNKSFNNMDCAHSGIPRDSYIINLIKNEIITSEKNLEEFTEDKRKAIKSYNKDEDYEQNCNEALYFFNREDMDEVDWF